MPKLAGYTTVAQYLELDRVADEKLELLNGVVVAMAGASPRHNLIVSNIARAMGNGLQGRPCLVMTQDQRVHVEATQSFTYPDVVVVCDEPSFETTERPYSLKNPSLVVEVLSATTLSHDLGAKLGHYRQIPSVRDLLFVHTETRSVTLISRQDDGSWKLMDRGPDGTVDVLGVTLSLDGIYDRAETLPM